MRSKRNKRLYSYSDGTVLEYCSALNQFATIVTDLPDIKLVIPTTTKSWPAPLPPMPTIS